MGYLSWQMAIQRWRFVEYPKILISAPAEKLSKVWEDIRRISGGYRVNIVEVTLYHAHPSRLASTVAH